MLLVESELALTVVVGGRGFSLNWELVAAKDPDEWL